MNFYVIDGDNPTSIVSTIRFARDNARTLRPLISTEMWVQLNVFYNRLAELSAEDLAPGNLAALFAMIKEACQTHTGITEGTFFRDQGWYFYQIGRYIERADQTTRLLDIKYHLLLPSLSDVGSPVDVSQWNALLRSAAGYHAYRRLHAASTTPARVAGFMLLNNAFPRSVHHCVREVGRLLGEVKSHHGLRNGNDAAEELDRLQAVLGTFEISAILRSGLHEFLDSIQRQLMAVTRELSIAFFGYTSRGVSSADGELAIGRPMPVLTVRHLTTYRYKQPVAFGEHRMMLRPRDYYDQKLLEAKLVITPEPTDIRWVHDVFGNCVAVARFSGRAQELRFESVIRLEQSPTEVLEFQIEEYARRYPFTYGADEMPDLLRAMERQYLDPEHEVDQWARQFLRHDGRTETTELLAAMTHAIRQNLTYVRREESGVQDPVRTLRLGSGSCRDFTVLMMEAVRSLGLAAHFVSGYLYVHEGGSKAGGSAAAPPTLGCAFICREPAGSSSTRRTASSAITI